MVENEKVVPKRSLMNAASFLPKSSLLLTISFSRKRLWRYWNAGGLPIISCPGKIVSAIVRRTVFLDVWIPILFNSLRILVVFRPRFDNFIPNFQWWVDNFAMAWEWGNVRWKVYFFIYWGMLYIYSNGIDLYYEYISVHVICVLWFHALIGNFLSFLFSQFIFKGHDSKGKFCLPVRTNIHTKKIIGYRKGKRERKKRDIYTHDKPTSACTVVNSDFFFFYCFLKITGRIVFPFFIVLMMWRSESAQAAHQRAR